ncbi:MAG: hypothetical protein ACI9MB_000571, partial [Verrucomicrobiales bacterium]
DLLRDDGAIVYINGAEVHRSNMPGGEITYLDYATRALLGNEERQLDVITVQPSFLNQGENVIAVEVHQDAPGSSDMSFDLEASDAIFPAPPVLEQARLTVFANGVTSLDLRAVDCDDPDADLRFDFSQVSSGRFELTSSPGVAIASATQAQVVAGQISFVAIEQSFANETIAGLLTDPVRHNEISGIVASLRNPGVIWANEDSDNPATLIALGTDASDRGEWSLDLSINTDWEDIAAAEIDGQALLYIGDFGDNGAARPSLQILRVVEPLLKGNTGGTIPQEDIELIEILYPEIPAGDRGGAARDAESMIVDPHSGDIYILTKRELVGRLFRLAHQASYVGTQTLEYLGDLNAITNDRRYGFSTSSTAADISPDGLEVIVRNYDSIQRFTRPNLGTPIATMLTGSEIEALPFVGFGKEPIGEAICFSADGDGYYTVGEKPNASIELPLYYYPRLPPDAAPRFSVTVSDGDLSDGPHEALIILADSPKDAWRQSHFAPEELGNPDLESSLWGDLADPDSDGGSNLVEYALGTDPRRADTADNPRVTAAPGSLTLLYEMDTAKTDISLQPQLSSDLRSWADVTSQLVSISRGIEARSATTESSGSNPIYFRLEISSN